MSAERLQNFKTYCTVTVMSKYFKRFVETSGGQKNAASLLEVSFAAVQSYCLGRRRVPTALALKIETLTNGQFKKERFIWPHLEDEEPTKRKAIHTYHHKPESRIA